MGTKIKQESFKKSLDRDCDPDHQPNLTFFLVPLLTFLENSTKISAQYIKLFWKQTISVNYIPTSWRLLTITK